VNIDLPYENSNNGTVAAGSPEWTDVVTINFNVIDYNNVTNLSWITISPYWGIYDANNFTLWEAGLFDGDFELSVGVNDGWNTVSVPGINPNGQGINNWWPGRDLSTNVFKMDGNYIPVTSTIPGEGYWMKHTGTNLYNTGDEWPPKILMVQHQAITAVDGWNLIGGFENEIQVSGLTTIPPGLISGSVFTYTDEYQIASAMEPGRGYFVFLTGSGQIIVEDGLRKADGDYAGDFEEDWGKVTITDASGRDFSLYLVNDEVDLSLYKLPPLPPEEGFDIRFSSGSMVESSNSSQTIELTGLEFPISISVENISISLQNTFGKVINPDLKPGKIFPVVNKIDKLDIFPVETLTPAEYTLEQNYPNPFNPATIINFAVPNESFVNLSIYNTLGELVSTLVNEQKKPGSYEYEFNGSGLASGIYLYRIQAGDFIQTKKMTLVK
jgi:hypothetical protein